MNRDELALFIERSAAAVLTRTEANDIAYAVFEALREEMAVCEAALALRSASDLIEHDELEGLETETVDRAAYSAAYEQFLVACDALEGKRKAGE